MGSIYEITFTFQLQCDRCNGNYIIRCYLVYIFFDGFIQEIFYFSYTKLVYKY